MTSGRPLLLAPAIIEHRGAEQESLCSMLRRTCERNQLLVNHVVEHLDLPISRSGARKAQMLKEVHIANGVGARAERLIEALKVHAVEQRWSDGTLKHLCGIRGVAALPVTPHRRWCGECYEQDCTQPHGPYDRLLWSIPLVEICPKHKVRLDERCMSCGGDRLRVLAGMDISGFCPRCREYLGGKREPLPTTTDDHSRYLLWIANSIASLLNEPLPFGHDAQTPFQAMLRATCGYHFAGVLSRLAQAISRNKSVVSTWLAGTARPGWLALCDISFALHIPLRDLLLGDEVAIKFASPRSLPLVAKSRPSASRRRPRTHDTRQMAHFFEEVRSGQHPTIRTMQAVADKLSIHSRELWRLLPAEAAVLSESLKVRRREAAARAKAQRDSELEQAIRQVAQEIAVTDRAPTRRSVVLRLSQLGLGVRHGESRSILMRAIIATQEARQSGSGNS